MRGTVSALVALVFAGSMIALSACSGDSTDKTIEAGGAPSPVEAAGAGSSEVDSAPGDEFPPGEDPLDPAAVIGQEEAMAALRPYLGKFGDIDADVVVQELLSYEDARKRLGAGTSDDRVEPERLVWLAIAKGTFTTPHPYGIPVPEGITAFVIVDAYSALAFERGVFTLEAPIQPA